LQLVATRCICRGERAYTLAAPIFNKKSMPALQDQALWSISAFDALRNTPGTGAHAGLQRQTLIASTLQAELRTLERRKASSDALEVIAACVRLRESALVYLQCEGSVWPITLFPEQMTYHSPRSLLHGTPGEISSLTTLDVDPPGVRPPGHWMHERIARADAYHQLTPVLWLLALQGPRVDLLHEIGGTAAYRALRIPAAPDLPTPGALGPAIQRLRTESAPLRKIAGWPGMSLERASRMLNALYLTSNLIVSRAHHSAQPGMLNWLFGRRGH
jgi:hypothetical protein